MSTDKQQPAAPVWKPGEPLTNAACWDGRHAECTGTTGAPNGEQVPCACPHHRASSKPTAPDGIYVASKAKHGERWKALRAAGVPIVSSWIDECGEGETASWSDSWSHFVREASTARAVVFYCEAGETHKGALVEIGCALAAGRPVYVVGPIDHSWVNHPLVSRCHSLETAIAAAIAAAPVATAPEVRALVEHCPDCHGKGEIDIGCRYCGDSTYDHECEERLRPCLTCKWVRDALAAVTVAPVPALVEEARRQFGPCVNYAPPIHCFHEVPLRHVPVTPCLPCLGRRLAADLAAATASLSATEGALASAQSAIEALEIERDRLTSLLAVSDGVLDDLRRLDGMGKAPTLEEVDQFLYKDPQAATAATVPATSGKETT